LTTSPLSHESPDQQATGTVAGIGFPLVVVLAAWIAIIVFVDPAGEFMVNDDWAYVRLLDGLKHGTMLATGWGSGGPSAIVHVLWGGLFTHFTGFSLTGLRISVLCEGIVGSMALLALLRLSGASPGLSLLAALTAVFNPLYLSQSFTFMTDITFAMLVIFSLLFFQLGVDGSRPMMIVAGMVFALCSILTRQLGVVVPAAFVVTCLIHPRGMELGRLKMIALVVGLVLIPWMAYESFLFEVGSTPVTGFHGVANILGKPAEKGLVGYLTYLFSALVPCGLGYVSFFMSPVVTVAFPDYLRRKKFLHFLAVLAACFVALEAAILAGFIDPPVLFHRNVIFDFGIGPILLKDTYILGIQRSPTIPKALYCFFVFWTVLAASVLVVSAGRSVSNLLTGRVFEGMKPMSFTATLSLLCALGYLGIISLAGYHDRYLIPLIIFLLVWFVSTHVAGAIGRNGLRKLVPGLITVSFIGLLSATGVRDFMEMKRSLARAQQYVVQELGTQPCNFDGGFEFNGYHCYRKAFKTVSGLSWWWVSREDYVLALGPLPGYRVVRTFPFDRVFGKSGAVNVLQSETQH